MKIGEKNYCTKCSRKRRRSRGKCATYKMHMAFLAAAAEKQSMSIPIFNNWDYYYTFIYQEGNAYEEKETYTNSPSF